MSELKPCPFWDFDNAFDDVVNAWNRRANDGSLCDRVENQNRQKITSL